MHRRHHHDQSAEADRAGTVNGKPIEAVTGITAGILLLVAIVFLAVLFGPGFTADQRTMVITSAVGALGVVGGYWLNSSADQAKKDKPPDAPATVTTTVTTGVPVAPIPPVQEIPNA